MSRYFFHIQDGHTIPDDVGVDCTDDEAARLLAMDKYMQIVQKLGREFWNGHLWQMKVVDDTGRRVFSLRARGHVQEHF